MIGMNAQVTSRAAVPMEDPFWNGGMFRAGRAVDADTMRLLAILHAMCAQLAASTAQAAVERDRFDSLFVLFDAAAGGPLGAAGELGARGDALGGVLTTYLWDLTRLYAQAALDYAWVASHTAGKLATGQPVAPLTDWPDDERLPGGQALTADIGRRLYPLQLLSPPSRLGPWYAEQITELNAFLTDTHRQMVDAATRVLEANPDDLRTDGLEGERLLADDRHAYDPRQVDLYAAAVALHAYASRCARAVVLLDVTRARGGDDEP
jgi:hypothetical protein